MKTIRRFSLLFVVLLVTFPTTVFLYGPQEETPRMKCLQKCQKEHLECLTAAKDDEKKKSACIKTLSTCEKACPKPDASLP